MCLLRCLLIALMLCHTVLVQAAVSPSAPHYLNDILYQGHVLRWHNNTRYIYVTIVPGKNINGWKYRHSQMVKYAFREWEQAMQGRVHFVFTNNPYNTDIVVRFRMLSNGSAIGYQSIQFSPYNKQWVFNNADIVISMMDPTHRYFQDGEIKAIALHEVGHALGMKGHSSNPNDIMHSSLHQRTRGRHHHAIKLTPRDITTMRLLYQQNATITNPVGRRIHQ